MLAGSSAAPCRPGHRPQGAYRHGAALSRPCGRRPPAIIRRCPGTKPLQAECPLGLIEVTALDEADLNAASVVLIRSFATSPDSVTVNLRDVGDFLAAFLKPGNNNAFFTARLTPTDVASVPSGRKYLIVGTAAICTGRESGEMTIAESFKGTAVIANMSVNQRYRMQGIARLLLRACEQHAQAIGWDYISLKVHRENAAARALYQSSGFNVLTSLKPAGLSGFLSFGSGSQHIVMSKDIGSLSSL